MDAVLAFVDAMHASGMRPAEPVALMLRSGQRIRFECEGDRKGRKNGWAILHLDGPPAGAFGHYRLGICQRWRSGQTVGLTLAERKALAAEIEANRQQREREREAGWRAVAVRAVGLWEGSGPADATHPYLCRKNAAPEGLRQSGRSLILPMRDAHGAIWNVQKIFPDGAKRFLSGGRMQGLMWQAGSEKGGLCIGEGFATMAAVRAATGMAVCAALSADNLEAVALAMRAKWPGRDIILCADHDGAGQRNIGREKAESAARMIGARLASPVGEAQP